MNKNNEKDDEIKQLKNSITELQKGCDIKSEKLIDFENLFFDKENQEFYSSLEKFPPKIINKVNELKRENKWEAFIHLGDFFQNGGSIGGELMTDMIKRKLAFERNKREDLTPIGKIIYRYRKILKKNQLPTAAMRQAGKPSSVDN